MKLTLRPVGRGNWRPLVLEVRAWPRLQGSLFRGTPWRPDSIDSDRSMVRRGDVWNIDGRAWRIAEIKP